MTQSVKFLDTKSMVCRVESLEQEHSDSQLRLAKIPTLLSHAV